MFVIEQSVQHLSIDPISNNILYAEYQLSLTAALNLLQHVSTL